MSIELLTPAEMATADALTIAAGTAGIVLMERAGQGVSNAVLREAGADAEIRILCGPGNNGGDGFVAARLLRRQGRPVRVAVLGDPSQLRSDARSAFEAMGGGWEALSLDFVRSAPAGRVLFVDALFGAGLDRPLEGLARACIEALNEAGAPVVAVDLPSGLNGADGRMLGAAVRARHTVTFCRRKPGHLLQPGRCLCGTTEVVDIGIADATVASLEPTCFANAPGLWRASWHPPAPEGHKYDRGHAVVVSGPLATTGAARLAASAALRAGAGLVTVACDPSALIVHAAHLTAVMVRPVRGVDGLGEMLADRRLNAVLFGPGAGVGEGARSVVKRLLDAERAVVLDADALTSFGDAREHFLALSRAARGPLVLTPHDGEFQRLFPAFAGLDRLSAARAAARECGAVVVLKGADTVIADPQGRAAINDNASPWLATAGTGDVLAGIVTGLLAQGLPAFEAAAMAVWMHGEAGRVAGAGLISEDLLPALKLVVAGLAGEEDR
ncbi:NAD(P)H-hydrate dehydratase [Polymorphum gilvum]|uniref:Bifunctional NAD(P)H-hydrate repair enzyme n=1 Tax=Polymorphum gilvum (strain LMG 25793 / CGMCC 1.9160 / SL003B-26A1) TaxID=991905 RepID=F2IXY3_POLGS|nr:NAD(P)H-hydrate dehydratase [Polymorphum gilvum]ADZ70486.1 Carbohydrate kinase, YjeF related protein [Polymorphum gilvum SL003B-26A1]